ncbi:MAG: cupin domain-containing protein [Actinobacteria bacterium]|nr:cupin domain-containing protein [Actinomycetota bacterium]
MNILPSRALRTFSVVVAFGILTLAGCSSTTTSSSQSSTTSAAVANGKPQSSLVLDKQAQTVLDQLLQYPGGSQAQVSSAVLTIAPGVSTGLHKHDAPMYVYVLEGTITVTYDGGIVKNYSEGSAILEAVGVAHNGENKTDKPVKLLVVNMGAAGVANTVTL